MAGRVVGTRVGTFDPRERGSSNLTSTVHRRPPAPSSHPRPEELTLQHRQAAPTVNRTDRWRYRSALHAARVLNSLGGSSVVPAPRRSIENQDRPARRTDEVRPASS